MDNLNKRLVEVEYILKKLEEKYIKKIPKELWKYIEDNKDPDYVFYYNDEKKLEEQNLSIDTISILTYINIEYLLDNEQKNHLMKYLRKDELIAEQEKAKLYDPNGIFKSRKENEEQENSLAEIKIEKWYEKLFSVFKNMLKKLRG